jgi:Protein of unknown function (DUF3631)
MGADLEGGGMSDTQRQVDDLLRASDEKDALEVRELLSELAGFVERFVTLPSDRAADLLALWIFHTHAHEAAWATPYLRITSAAPESGKTLLMEILAELTQRGWHAVNPSVAVLYRKIDRQRPTLLLDEMDNYPLDDRRDALSVLNAGYKRGATVPRCKESGELEEFSCYCPKAYAGLDERQIVSTLLSRSITIRLDKQLPSEQAEMWIAPRTAPEAEPLRGRCAELAEKHAQTLEAAEPDLPAGMANRRAEVWWALLAIADLAAGDWPARAREAAREFASGGDATDGQADPVQLLLDIREAFGDRDTIFTKDLVSKLNALDESPWGARRRGEGLDARGLSRMLRPFKVKSRTVRVLDETAKGYHLEQFEDTFARHVPGGSEKGSQASQASQPAPHGDCDVTDVTDVTEISTPSDNGNGRVQETLGEAWKRLEREREDKR